MSDFYTRGDFDTFHGAPPKKDNLFLWTVFILLLIGFAIACWLGSFYVFGHPERAKSYEILKKLHKLDPPKRFEITAAPAGEFLTVQKLFERYNTFTPLELQNENDELLRMYISNYQNTKRLVPYIVGRFTILNSHELKPSDLFPSGVVAVTQAADFPQVMMEHVYTADATAVPSLQRMLKTGLEVKLARTLDLAAVIHIQRLESGSLEFTAVPLLYGSYALKQGSGTFTLEPPPGINLLAGLPIVRGAGMQDALKEYASIQNQSAPGQSALEQPTAATPAASAKPASELVRVDASPNQEISLPMQLPKGKGRATPAASVAVAMASPAPVHVAASRRTAISPAKPTPPITVVMNNNVAEREPGTFAPAPTPPPVTPQVRSATGVPLTPFLQSAPAPQMANTGASWRTYAPGQMPRGRIITPTEAAPLAESGVGGERLYLRGTFMVTASSDNRAVLRPQSGMLGAIVRPNAGATRVIVEYPAGMQPPPEGASFSRDDDRPFIVNDVRRGADGQINVYVREITSEQ